jgi:hypothetical protein
MGIVSFTLLSLYLWAKHPQRSLNGDIIEPQILFGSGVSRKHLLLL